MPMPRTMLTAAIQLACLAGASAAEPLPPELAAIVGDPPLVAIVDDADAGVRAGGQKDAKLGAWPILEVKDHADEPRFGWVLQRVYLRFPLAGVAADRVASARLALFGNLGDGDAPVRVEVRALPAAAAGWDEATLTWNTQPELPSGDPAATVDVVFGHTPTRLTEGRWALSSDLSAAVTAALAERRDAISFVLTTRRSDEACIFTREHRRGMAVRPRLLIGERAP